MSKNMGHCPICGKIGVLQKNENVKIGDDWMCISDIARRRGCARSVVQHAIYSGLLTTDSQPNWTSPPGATIHDLMQTRKMSLDELAEKLELSREELRNLIAGVRAVTDLDRDWVSSSTRAEMLEGDLKRVSNANQRAHARAEAAERSLALARRAAARGELGRLIRDAEESGGVDLTTDLCKGFGLVEVAVFVGDEPEGDVEFEVRVEKGD